MAKVINFDFKLKNFDQSEISDPAYNWVKMILASGASDRESNFLKIFSLVEKINKNPKAVELDEGDESLVKKTIESFNLIDSLGNPRVDAYKKAQLTKCINDAREL